MPPIPPGFTFLKVRGIPIGANWTWLLVFALIVWSLGSALFPRTYPGLESSHAYAMAAITAVLFFGSILLHELGHAFRAIREGMTIEGITLWLFGGVARFRGMFPSPGAEFRIAVAGPLVSVALALGFGAVALTGGALDWPREIRGVVDYLARINAILVMFNAVPALPLDGGRVLRSWLWQRQADFVTATVSAARAGRAFGYLLIGTGLLGAFTGAGVGGLWFVFLGWFLLQAAQAEATAAQLHDAFAGLSVADVMTPNPFVIDASTPVDDFVTQTGWTRHSTYPVVEAGRPAGMVSLRLAAEVPPDRRGATLVRDAMVRDAPAVAPGTALIDALEALRPLGRAVVQSDDRVVGILSMSDVGRALELRQLRRPAKPPARGAGLLPWAVVVTSMALAIGLLWHPPLAVVSPGEAIDVARDVSVEEASSGPVSGRYLLTSVRLSQPSALFTAIAAIHPDQDVLPLGAVLPAGADPEQFLRDQQELFRQSRQLAAAAAAIAVGLKVEVAGSGARVVGIMPAAPAAEKLRTGDVIVAIDGREVRHVEDLREIVRGRPAGTSFAITVLRRGVRTPVTVKSARLAPGAEGAVGIGVFVETRDLDVRLPFAVRFRERDIGGPSAGLAYALAITDLLDPADLARGRSIAATGTIDLDGRVGPVGGVHEKAIAARERGADLLLVPAGELDAARGTGLEVRGVSSLTDALAMLRGRA